MLRSGLTPQGWDYLCFRAWGLFLHKFLRPDLSQSSCSVRRTSASAFFVPCDSARRTSAAAALAATRQPATAKCPSEEVAETRRAGPVAEIGATDFGQRVCLVSRFQGQSVCHRSGGLTAASAWADNRAEAEEP
jgi:hypothetical protein